MFKYIAAIHNWGSFGISLQYQSLLEDRFFTDTTVDICNLDSSAISGNHNFLNINKSYKIKIVIYGI